MRRLTRRKDEVQALVNQCWHVSFNHELSRTILCGRFRLSDAPALRDKSFELTRMKAKHVHHACRLGRAEGHEDRLACPGQRIARRRSRQAVIECAPDEAVGLHLADRRGQVDGYSGRIAVCLGRDGPRRHEGRCARSDAASSSDANSHCLARSSEETSLNFARKLSRNARFAI